MDTRTLFFDVLEEIAERDDDVIFLTGDLGYPFMNDFQTKFPEKFINCGIQEQNMVGVAAGLARAGAKPIVYSGAKFLLYRAAEQMRDDVAIPKLNVKFIGTGAAGFLGFTHNFQETESPKQMVNRMPNLAYAEPRDYASMKMSLAMPGPVFVRL